MKKQFLTLTAISTALLFATPIFAADNNSYKEFANDISAPIVGAINKIAADVHSINAFLMTSNTQTNLNQDKMMKSNQSSLSSQEDASKNNQEASLGFVTHQLQQFQNNYHKNDLNYKPPASSSNTASGAYLKEGGPGEKTLLQTLSGLNASDSIASESSQKTNLFQTASPKLANNDPSISFSSLINSNQYSNPIAAQHFIDFVSQSYQDLSDGLKLSDLGAMDDSTTSEKQTKSDAITAVVSSSAYQDYSTAVRAIVAQQSIGYNNLNYLMSERTGNPSTLSNEAAKIQARIGTPQWYSNLNSAKPATLQRKTLIVLAEIENEMHQNRLINERTLATLSAMELQNSQQSITLLKMKQSAVNQKISACTADPTSDKCKSNTDPLAAPDPSKAMGKLNTINN